MQPEDDDHSHAQSSGQNRIGFRLQHAEHDVNDNQKLDTNWIGIPKEPVAISNNARGRLGPPKWKDAMFELREATQELTVNLMRI